MRKTCIWLIQYSNCKSIYAIQWNTAISLTFVAFAHCFYKMVSMCLPHPLRKNSKQNMTF